MPSDGLVGPDSLIRIWSPEDNEYDIIYPYLVHMTEYNTIGRQHNMDSKVDKFIATSAAWQNEYIKLREIIHGFPLEEALKWGVPCYALQGKNVVLMHGFKEYCALLFFKGALLPDPKNLLIQQTKNVQSSRQIRFTGLQDIIDLEDTIKMYVSEAMKVEESGLEVQFKTPEEYDVPIELQNKFAEIPDLQTAFAALTPGRRRAYLLYFAEPKMAKTREARVEKYTTNILDGKGLYD